METNRIKEWTARSKVISQMNIQKNYSIKVIGSLYRCLWFILGSKKYNKIYSYMNIWSTYKDYFIQFWSKMNSLRRAWTKETCSNSKLISWRLTSLKDHLVCLLLCWLSNRMSCLMNFNCWKATCSSRAERTWVIAKVLIWIIWLALISWIFNRIKILKIDLLRCLMILMD